MTAKKTQCPFCESIFAVTPEQLSARGGHVRCGKCFQVFKADEHLVRDASLGSSTPAPSHDSTVAADIFDMLDQPHHEDSDTLAGQPALPSTQARPSSTAKASDLGQLEQKTDLEPDFDALFSALAPQSIDPHESYAQSKNAEFEPDSVQPEATPTPLSTPLPNSAQSERVAKSFNLELPALEGSKNAAQIQDTPPPGSVPAVVLPAVGAQANPTKAGISVFNKKQQTSARLSSLKLDDELSEMFLGDGSAPIKDILKHHNTAGVDKLSKTADESWADALLQEEEATKKAKAEQQADELLGSKKPPSVMKPSAAPLRSTTATVQSKPVSDQSTHRSVALEEDDLLSYLSQVGAASEKADDLGGSRASHKRAPQTHILPPPASHRIRVPVQPQQSTGHHVAWGAMCGLLLLLLCAQWLYFHFSDLASNPRHNSRLTTVCAMIGCQVPSMDLSQISTGRLKLQRSPNDSNTTQVTLTLTNQANNSQLLPKLKFLQLSDGKVDAYRLVEPHEYLQGNDRQLKQFLPRQSLKVAFDLNTKRSAIKTYAVDPVY